LADRSPETVQASFEVTVDTTHADLSSSMAQPLAGPVSIDGGTSALRLRGLVKRPAILGETIWLELWVENSGPALRNVTMTLTEQTGADSIADAGNDVFATAPLAGAISLGGIAADGVGRAALRIVPGAASISLTLQVTGTTTDRRTTTSGPVAVTPDGAEVWAVVPDADVAVVVDAATDKRLAQVQVPGRPAGISISPDGALVFVVSSAANTLTVIDRAQRAVTQTLAAAVGRETRHVVTSPDGRFVFVSGYVSDSIARFERRGSTLHAAGTLAVGRRPSGMSIDPTSSLLLVSHFLPRGRVYENESWLSAVDPQTLTLRREVVIGDEFNVEPVGCLADVFAVSASRVTMEGAATQLAGVFLAPGGARAWAPGMRISPTPVIEAGPKALETVFSNVPPGRFAPAFMFLFDTRDPAQPQVMASTGVVDPPDVNPAYVTCSTFGQEIELASRVMLDDQRQVNLGPALPTGASGLTQTGVGRAMAFTRGGRWALMASYIADELVVTDATTQHPATQRHLPLSGSNPIGLAVSPDGEKAWVAYENSLFLSVLDLSMTTGAALPEPRFTPFSYEEIEELGPGQAVLSRLRLVRHIADVPDLPPIAETGQVTLVDADPVPARQRLGRVYFRSSNPDKYPQLSSSRQASCSTCHPDGGSDGSVWATMEGERRTMSLRGGLKGRGWLHASATHEDAHEFVEIVVRERLGGDPDAEAVAVLAEYLDDGIGRLQPPQTDPQLVAEGADVFEAHCAGCHAGPTFSSGEGPILYDLGTRTDNARALMGPFFESIFPTLEAELLGAIRGDRDLGPDDRAREILDFRPRPVRKAGQLKALTLVNTWDSVLFFHDGRFDSMRDAVQYVSETLSLGLTTRETDAVTEYLKTL